MKKQYMSDPSYSFEKVNRASLACGPLVKWAIAQVSYLINHIGIRLVREYLTSRPIILMRNFLRKEEQMLVIATQLIFVILYSNDL